jgi:hypothetical protein
MTQAIEMPRRRMGPAPAPRRDGDKYQARRAVRLDVESGRRPHANDLPCTDCGHIWRPGQRRHEYDHHLGYGADHHFDVQAVCSLCHHARDNRNKAKTHCLRGHPFSAVNTRTDRRGRRFCRECARIAEAARPPRSKKARAAHPDTGGSDAAMARLNAARDQGRAARG